MSLTPWGSKDELERVRRDVSLALVDEPEEGVVPRRRRVRGGHARLGPLLRRRAQQEHSRIGRPRRRQGPRQGPAVVATEREAAAVRRYVQAGAKHIMQIALRRNLTEEQAGLDATFHLVRLDVVEHHRVLDGSVLDRADDR